MVQVLLIGSTDATIMAAAKEQLNAQMGSASKIFSLSDPMEALSLVRASKKTLLVGHVAKQDDLVKLVMLLKVARNEVTEGKLRAWLISPLAKVLPQEKIVRYGFSELLEDPMPPRTLAFKIKQHVTAWASVPDPDDFKAQGYFKVSGDSPESVISSEPRTAAKPAAVAVVRAEESAQASVTPAEEASAPVLEEAPYLKSTSPEKSSEAQVVAASAPAVAEEPAPVSAGEKAFLSQDASKPTLSPIALAFLVSELLNKGSLSIAQVAARFCAYLGASCAGCGVELWQRDVAGGKWVRVDQGSASAAGAKEVLDVLESKSEASSTNCFGLRVFGPGDRWIGAVVVSGPEVSRVSVDYLTKATQSVRGIFMEPNVA